MILGEGLHDLTVGPEDVVYVLGIENTDPPFPESAQYMVQETLYRITGKDELPF